MVSGDDYCDRTVHSNSKTGSAKLAPLTAQQVATDRGGTEQIPDHLASYAHFGRWQVNLNFFNVTKLTGLSLSIKQWLFQ